MSTAAELLADLIGPACDAWPGPTPAKAAKAANPEHSCGLAGDLVPCEALRIPANCEQRTAGAAVDSQTFAAVRNRQTGPESKQPCGLSQDSQDSQGWAPTCTAAASLDLAAVAWTNADIARFTDRRARLLRWGWADADAERMAERLVIRDRGGDLRVSCTECVHYRPGRCGNHKAAALLSPEVGRDLAALLQRCPGFSA